MHCVALKWSSNQEELFLRSVYNMFLMLPPFTVIEINSKFWTLLSHHDNVVFHCELQIARTSSCNSFIKQACQNIHIAYTIVHHFHKKRKKKKKKTSSDFYFFCFAVHFLCFGADRESRECVNIEHGFSIPTNGFIFRMASFCLRQN